MAFGRLTVVLAVGASACAAVVPALSSAERRATAAERMAVIRAVQGRTYPVMCAVVYISTVNSTWASEEFIGGTGMNIPHGCLAVAANGIAIVHVEDRHWRVVTEGSSFRCPLAGSEVYPGQPNVPNSVADDLVPALRCTTIDCPRFIVGRANSSAYPKFQLPARGTAVSASCATLQRIARRLYDGTYKIPSGAVRLAPHYGSTFGIQDLGRRWACQVEETGLSGPSDKFRCTRGKAQLRWTTG